MSRIYEFLESRMSVIDKDVFSRYYETRKFYQFMPKVSDISVLERYIAKEQNPAVKGILNKPIITVEVKPADETNKYYMSWYVEFEGVELKVECFSIEEELYNQEEIENVAMWMTHMNSQELNWKQAVNKLHKMYKTDN